MVLKSALFLGLKSDLFYYWLVFFANSAIASDACFFVDINNILPPLEITEYTFSNVYKPRILSGHIQGRVLIFIYKNCN